MIVGIGHDVTDMDRVQAIVAGKAGRRFLERILTGRERERIEGAGDKRVAQYAAGRFAAKEAVVKALGCGIGEMCGFADIEILPDKLGKPECRVSEASLRKLGYDPGTLRIHITITHDRTIASAVAVAERTDV
ncbi:holo-ACP synthase [Paenibacillus sp. NPDC058071]|uniref:holo-ACP synthase n=1 Tax=Paenibacillus sp. NPDC058071 TaxID=3346326 RepID=UPI0036D9008F